MLTIQSEAYERIKDILSAASFAGTTTEWMLLDVQVCQRTWKRLHAIGAVLVVMYFVTKKESMFF